MKKPVVVTLPHPHTKGEARKRIEDGITRVRPQIMQFAAALEDEWQEDELSFRMVMMGQEVTGRIHVMDQSARVEVDLPWVLAMLADRVRGQIEKKGGQILLERK